MQSMLNGMFGKIQPGLCRLSMSGGIAVKTSNGYKSYNVKTGRLTNCDSFVFKDFGEEFFFVIPTNKAAVGDIILISGKPKCVIEIVNKNQIKVMNYEDSTIETVVPERHIFMGNTYFYGKIVSMFGSDLLKGKKGSNKIMQYMMMSEMLKGTSGNPGVSNQSGMSAMLPFMMMNGGMGNMFDGMFDFDIDDGEPDCDNESEDDE